MAAGKLAATKIFKDRESIAQYLCCECHYVLEDPVQLCCGHRLCRACADELTATESPPPKCPECQEDIIEEEGAKVHVYTSCNQHSAHARGL